MKGLLMKVKQNREVGQFTINNRFVQLDNGVTFINNQYFVFKFLGSFYTSNLKRKQMYAMDDRYWFPMCLPIWKKVLLIVTTKVRKVQNERKTTSS